MAGLGNTPMPDGFKYGDVFAKGRPRHQKTDPFGIRHPSMEVSKRAKIFAPFDALRGFSAAIMAETAKAMRADDLSG